MVSLPASLFVAAILVRVVGLDPGFASTCAGRQDAGMPGRRDARMPECKVRRATNQPGPSRPPITLTHPTRTADPQTGKGADARTDANARNLNLTSHIEFNITHRNLTSDIGYRASYRIASHRVKPGGAALAHTLHAALFPRPTPKQIKKERMKGLYHPPLTSICHMCET